MSLLKYGILYLMTISMYRNFSNFTCVTLLFYNEIKLLKIWTWKCKTDFLETLGSLYKT